MISPETIDKIKALMAEASVFEDDLDESFILGGGPGGQKTNKTSNVVRLSHEPSALTVRCAATRSRLHLVKPLGFDISDKAVKRAGLDYWHMVDIHVYENLDDFFARNPAPDLWLATTKAPRDYTQAEFSSDCWLMFGKETAGLPLWLREKYYERCIRIPMRSDARSLNLANSVAILTYEALRQQGFPGLSGEGEMAGEE